MGIQGLIPYLEKVSTPTRISDFSGATVAVDAYCWLHKGAFSCAEKLARGEKCDAYVHYCMKFINMLLKYGIKPILVFDGRHLPAKQVTEKKRRENRELSRRKAAELLRQDKPDQARTYIRRCIDITHNMAVEVMQACRSINVDCITAPYEADAQLAFLNRSGIADIVITEDSDLLLFGCSKVIFKMDINGGGLMISNENLHVPMKINSDKYTFDKFVRMCILSGCDYLPSLPGIGLSKACRFITRTCDPDIHRALTRLGSQLNMSLNVTKEYRDSFVHAEAMFKHQPVYDPIKRKVVPLTPLDSNSPPLNLPQPLSDCDAYQLALGNLDPFTLKPVCNWDPENAVKILKKPSSKVWCNFESIWSENYTPNQYVFSRAKAQRPVPTTGKLQVQSAGDPFITRKGSFTTPCPSLNGSERNSSISIIEDSDLETVLIDEENQDSSLMEQTREELNDSAIDVDMTDVSKDPVLVDLSPKRESTETVVNKLKRKRHTVVNEKCKEFSRYFFNSACTKEEKDCPNGFVSNTDGILLDAKIDEKLKDLSNKLDCGSVKPDVKLSPKLNCSKDDIENMFIESSESAFSESFDSVEGKSSNKSSTFISSQNSVTCSQPESNSQSKQNKSSLFKWKTKFHETFSYNQVKYQGSKSATSCSPIKTVASGDNGKCKIDESNRISSSIDDQRTQSDNYDNETYFVDNSLKSPLSAEKKRKFNPFKVNSNEQKTPVQSFSLLRDPVPDSFSQDIDESFIKKPDYLITTKTPPSTVTSGKKKTITKSSSRNRSVGLSKKSAPSKPIQKSLLSMFMLQPKPKLQPL